MTKLIDLVLAESCCLVPPSELSTDCSFDTSLWRGLVQTLATQVYLGAEDQEEFGEWKWLLISPF